MKVAEVFELQMGKTPARDRLEYWNNGDHEWVSIKDLGAYDKYVGRTKETISELGRMESGIKSVPAGTLIMSFKLSLGKAAITTKETYTNEAIMAFLDKKSFEIDLNYMWHQFRSKDWGRETNAAVKGKTLNKKSLGSVEIVVPSIEVQLGVAAKLDRLLEQIEFARQEERLLDSLVKSQFVEMFGDWQSGYRYELQKLGPLLSAEPQNGLYKPQKYYVDEGGVPIVRVDAFQTGFIEDFGALKRLECSRSEIDIYGLLENDIVINRVNGSIERVGKVAWIHGLVEPTVFESNMMRFHVDENRLELAYITAFLNSDDIRQQIKSRARIANQCSINQGNVMDFDIPLPPLALQQQFAAFVAEVDKSRFVARKSAELIMNMQALDIRPNARLQ